MSPILIWNLMICSMFQKASKACNGDAAAAAAAGETQSLCHVAKCGTAWNQGGTVNLRACTLHQQSIVTFFLQRLHSILTIFVSCLFHVCLVPSVFGTLTVCRLIDASLVTNGQQRQMEEQNNPFACGFGTSTTRNGTTANLVWRNKEGLQQKQKSPATATSGRRHYQNESLFGDRGGHALPGQFSLWS